MKHILQFISAFVVLSTSYTLQAQSCIADAGGNQNWCVTHEIGSTPAGDSVLVLGGNPTATGGTPPYTYQWSMEPVISPISGIAYYASNYLNDTTLANPALLYPSYNQPLHFYLRIEDSNNNVCYDTIRVTSVGFILDLKHFSYQINKGDSIQLALPVVWPISGNIDSILWRPNHGLIDSNSLQPWAKPEKDIIYYHIVWDSSGCRQDGWPFFEVIVHNVSIEDFDENEAPPFSVYPTIIENGIPLTVKALQHHNPYTFSLYDMQGRVVFEELCNNDTHEFYVGHLSKGVYLYQIRINGVELKKGKIIIQ